MKRILINILFLVLFPSLSYSGNSIFLIKSRDIEPLNTALGAAVEVLHSAGLDSDIRIYNLAGDKKKWGEVLTEVNLEKPRMLITFGTFATETAKKDIRDIPIVFSNVLNPEESRIVRSLSSPDENVTGASLDISPELQFSYLLKVIPSARKIGVLYNPDETGLGVLKAKAAAAKMGLELVDEPVRSIDELPKAIKKVLRKVDVLWSVADGTILSRTTISEIIVESINQNIPFMGLSPKFVQAGALFSLSLDDNDIGRQAGEIAIKVLSGKSGISDIPVSTPRKVKLSINLKTSKTIGLKISDDVLNAAEVVR